MQLGKTDICVLYMNIRSKEDKGYPPRDDIPANILTPLTPLSEEEYAFQCRVFFATVFKRLGAFLEETNTCRVLSDPGDDKRTRFFEGVREDLGNVSAVVIFNFCRTQVSTGRTGNAPVLERRCHEKVLEGHG